MSYLKSKLPESLPVETVRGFSADLKGLIAFCASKPADATYCYTSIGHCLLAQFFTACGLHGVIVGSQDYASDEEPKAPLAPGWDYIAGGLPRTYGAALSRARSALREGG